MTRSRESSARPASWVREKEQCLGARMRSSTTAGSESCVYDGVPRWRYAACALAEFAPGRNARGPPRRLRRIIRLGQINEGVDRTHLLVGSASWPCALYRTLVVARLGHA